MHIIKSYTRYFTSVIPYLNESVKNQVWYHGGEKKVKKFLFSLVGKNNSRISNYHGFGIYFISSIDRAKTYGNIITKITIDENSDILENAITKTQLQKIYKQLIIENVKLRSNDYKFYNNPPYDDKHSIVNDVEAVYEFLTRGYYDSFKSSKDVTEFLIRCNIDGMIVTNDVNDKILIVFNEKIINIIN